MTTQNFLVEIGTEELPPKALKTLATSFADNVEAELNQAGLTFDKIEWFAAPRRLAVKVLNLATQQPSKEIEKQYLATAQNIIDELDFRQNKSYSEEIRKKFK